MSIDPLAQVIGLLRPAASMCKLVTASGRWAVRPPGEHPFYGALLEGQCQVRIAGREPLTLRAGDFILIPDSHDFTMTSPEPPFSGALNQPIELMPGEFHLGASGQPDVRMLVGYCTFESPDATLLVSLLPDLVLAKGEQRLSTLVQLLRDEWRSQRPGREVVLGHLLEVLLIEAVRSAAETDVAPGLLRGLADPRLAIALRQMHAHPTTAWTMNGLASEAGLSRSSFFDRFRREVGVAPMEYLLGWRMALAKALLRSERLSMNEVAERVGYSSSSTFSVAFTRHVGLPPSTYARA